MFGEIYKVIVVTASESSLVSLETILENLTGCLGNSVVLVLPDTYKGFKTQLKKVLGSYAKAQFVKDLPLKIAPGGVYLLDPDNSYEINRECELVTVRSQMAGDQLDRNRSLDQFLRSVSACFSENCVAVVLGGVELNGAEGCFAVHNAGGLVVVQDPLSCQYDLLPNSVIARGVADIVVDVEDIADLLVNICKGHEITEKYLSDLDVMQVNRVMEILSGAYEVDFGLYKLSTVRRRIFRRMRLCNLATVDEYAALLEEDHQELHALYQDLLIGVTCFFRDKEAFAVCQKDILPGLIKAAANRQEFRIWDAACATGQEAYSLAILCHEITRELELNVRIKIVATDVDADSIVFASRGIYSANDLNNMPIYLRDRYFVQVEPDQYQIIQEIRQKVIFSQHNLLQSPPFTRMDMVCCRNFLIYLKGKAQTKAVYLFHFALNTGGVLFLGPSETLGELETGFETIDRHWRFFRKKPAGKLYPRLNYAGFDRRASAVTVNNNCQPVLKSESSPVADMIDCYQQLLSTFVGSGVLIDDNNNIIQFFGQAQKYFNFKGPLNLNLLNVVSGELRLALSAGLRKMTKEKSDIIYDRVESVLFDGTRQAVKIVIKRIAARHRLEMRFIGLEPVLEASPTALPVAAFDTDNELACVNQMLEEELAHVKKALLNAMEELEANNEEYQAANEELTASNEELHATNEELHSVNEELFVVNSQYERKIDEVNQVNNDIKNLIDNMDLGVIFLDKELKIRYFSPIAEDLFHLQDQDIGRPIRHFRSRLIETEHTLEDDCRSVVESSNAIIRQVNSADGQIFQQKVLPYTNLAGNTGGVIITLVDLTERCLIEKRLEESETGYRNLFESIEEGMSLHQIVLDECGRPVDYIFEMFNPAFMQMTGLTEKVIGKSVKEIIPDIDESLIETYGRVAITGKSEIIEYYLPQYSRWYHIKAYCPEKYKFVCLCTDITEFKESQKKLLNNKKRFRAFFEQVNVIVFRCDTELVITDINREAELCYGISRDQARGKSFFELFITDDDDRELARDIQDKVLQGYPVYGMVNSITRADGQKLTLQWNSVREVDPDGPVLGVIVTARDITEEARMQDKLIEREELFRSIFEESPIGIELFNDSGKLMHINKAFVEILGISGDVNHFYDMNLFDEPELTRGMIDAVNAGQTVRYETKYDLERYRRKGLVSTSHMCVWIESHISAMYDSQRKVMGYLVQVINITQRKKALNELQDNRNKLELAQRTANVGYWQWNKQNDTYAFSAEAGLILNAIASEMALSKLQLQELLGSDWELFESNNKKVWLDGIPAEFFVRIIASNGHKDLKVNIVRESDSHFGTQGT
ncbi:MAG: PAS domain S-box protein, partial [Sedimentisphaerales bacterium]|nr:PAS domain S-box protein [Sedimentisphaerales bacterium]